MQLTADYVEESPCFGIVGEITDETLITIAGEHGHGYELTVGMKVEVIFDGPVMESYPVRGTAKEVAEAKMR